MMKAKESHQNKFLKILALPVRALAKARDFYVRSMNNYADKVYYGAAAAPGWGSAPYAVPRSFSTNTMRSGDDNDDFKELVRAASTNTLGNRLDVSSVFSAAAASNSNPAKEALQQQQTVVKRVPRSASVGMAKIEEDKPCEFDGEISNGLNNFGVSSKVNNDPSKMKDKFRMFPRSRSYAVGATKR